MRAVGVCLLVLLGLCGCGALTDPTDPTDPQTAPNIWTEIRALRDVVVELNLLVKQLQGQNIDLQTRLTINEVELLQSKSKIEQLEKENADLQTRLTINEAQLLQSKSKIEQLEKKNADLQTRLTSNEAESKSKIEQLEKENAGRPKVAFYAALTDAGQFGPFKTYTQLKYSKVFTNIGDAYSSETGSFTAPVRGVYYLQFTACGHENSYTAIQMYKNNQMIMANWKRWKESNREYITNSVVLELMARDKIHMTLPSNFTIYDNQSSHSTFSGALLFTL